MKFSKYFFIIVGLISWVFISHSFFIACTKLVPVMAKNGTEVYDVEELLRQNGTSINFDSVIRLVLKLTLKTIHLKALNKHEKPDCYKFKIDVSILLWIKC